jgi:hypothetical protein
MGKSWETLEDNVRLIAELSWNRQCNPENIAGVDIDAVLKLESDHYILLEITERRSLSKTRDDIGKLIVAKNSLFAKNIYAKCYCITVDSPTTAMQRAGVENQIEVKSFKTFIKEFYNYESYRHIRKDRSFGSSANPFTGEPDKSDYIPVHYYSKTLKRDIGIKEIS